MFRKLSYVNNIRFDAYYFRKLIHSQGIEWMRLINNNLTVDLTYILVGFWSGLTIKDFLPDADFCLWKDFPLEQSLIINQWAYWESNRDEDLNPSCLYLWLNQETNPLLLRKIPPCDFKMLSRRCNKTEFQQASFIWSVYDTKLISQGIQIFFSISSYFIYVFGIVTNSTLVYLFCSKKTRDTFGTLKHYPYLCAISAFNIIILIINLLSWISDCKDTLDIFCPETRKYIPIQFFKVKFNHFFIKIKKKSVFR